ncbi:plasmid segregation protein parM, partial [Shigella dysenteriae]
MSPVKCSSAIISLLLARNTPFSGNESNLLIVFYVQIMPDDLVM